MALDNKISRRRALAYMFGAGLGVQACTSLFSTPTVAHANTQDDLQAAQQQADQMQQQLAKISDEYAQLAQKQSETLTKIEHTNAALNQTNTQIAQSETDLATRKEKLANRIKASYKTGGNLELNLLFSSSSFEELTSNLYYMNEIMKYDKQLIDDVKQSQDNLNTTKSQLETTKTELESLQKQQEDELNQMRAKQQQAQDALNNADQKVKDILQQRDAELAAAAADAAAQQHAAALITGKVSFSDAPSGTAQRVIDACHAMPSPGQGLCAKWVSQVFQAAGLGRIAGNANDMYNAWCKSSNLSELKPAMIIAVSSHNRSAAGRIYGHVGVYVGNGQVMDNIGSIRTIDVHEWIQRMATTVVPRWGWANGAILS